MASEANEKKEQKKKNIEKTKRKNEKYTTKTLFRSNDSPAKLVDGYSSNSANG